MDNEISTMQQDSTESKGNSNAIRQNKEILAEVKGIDMYSIVYFFIMCGFGIGITIVIIAGMFLDSEVPTGVPFFLAFFMIGSYVFTSVFINLLTAKMWITNEGLFIKKRRWFRMKTFFFRYGDFAIKIRPTPGRVYYSFLVDIFLLNLKDFAVSLEAIEKDCSYISFDNMPTKNFEHFTEVFTKVFADQTVKALESKGILANEYDIEKLVKF